MPVRKSPLMLQVEAKQGKPLEELLPELYNEIGMPAMSEKLGVSRGTLWYWFLKFRIRFEKVAIPDEKR